MALVELIIDDIVNNRRTFLPGPGPLPAPDEVRANLEKPAFIGGLEAEEAALMLSVLRRDTNGLWLTPLDKGLSGSKVFEARYDLGGTRSKPYVMKVGPLAKIDREANALSDIVAPTLMGIGEPICRRGQTLGLVVQDLAGLSENASLESLRNRVRADDAAPDLVRRVLGGRLGRWYREVGTREEEFVLGALFEPYLNLGPHFGAGFPPDWEDLFDWVERETSCAWMTVEPVIGHVRSICARLPSTVVHGDLHTQNVLVDERGECWPIDFAWTVRESSPIVDLAMLECSLKFLALPMRSELRALIPMEVALARGDSLPALERVPYHVEAMRVYRSVQAVRDYSRDLGVASIDYRMGLLLMTFALATHAGLNTPYLLSSLQILASEVQREL